MNTAQEMAAIVYKALDDKKAFDIKILDIKKISAVADYFVIADGTNKNQVQAMCDSVEEEMHKAGYSLKSVEGYSQGGWILLDYYDIINCLMISSTSESVLGADSPSASIQSLRSQIRFGPSEIFVSGIAMIFPPKVTTSRISRP